MPETENDKTVELDVTGPGANIELPETENDTDKTFENEEKKMKQILRTIISPMTHLRNLMSSLFFEMKRTKAEKLYRKLLKKGVINKKITLKTLKNTLKALRKE